MINNYIVITRPKTQGFDFAKKICQKNPSIVMGDFLFEPLLEVKYYDLNFSDFNNYDFVITTSTHGKNLLSGECNHYSIGAHTPTAQKLAQKIVRDNNGKKLRLLYLRGYDISFDMKSEVENYGHKVDEIITYETIAKTELSCGFINALKNNQISAISFFSTRTAEIFVELVRKYEIIGDFKNIKVLCISDSMLECLHSIFINNINVSSTPDARGMSEMIIDHYKGYKL